MNITTFSANISYKLCRYTAIFFVSDGLAFDWIRNRLYWADACASEIEVYDLTAGFSRSLYTHSDGRVHDVAVDPFNGYGPQPTKQKIKGGSSNGLSPKKPNKQWEVPLPIPIPSPFIRCRI